MSDGSRHAAKLRDRLTNGTEDKLGKALADLLENPLITGTIGRAFDARERAAQAQELALSALNIPTAADIERLTRRLRSVSQRLEGIEDGVHRLNRALTEGSVERRLSAMEDQLKALSGRLTGDAARKPTAKGATAKRSPAKKATVSKPAVSKPAASKQTASKQTASKQTAKKTVTKKTVASKPAAKKPAATRPTRASGAKSA